MANELKKVAGFTPAQIKKISGVAMASVKKVAGVLYETTVAGGLTLAYQRNHVLGGRGGANVNSTGYAYFHRINLLGSLTLSKVYAYFNNATAAASAARSLSLSIGIYTLTGSTLTAVVTGSGIKSVTVTNTSINDYVTVNMAATYALDPNVDYFIGMRNGSYLSIQQKTIANVNGVYLFFARATATSSALPASIETSVLDISGSDAFRLPTLILSSV